MLFGHAKPKILFDTNVVRNMFRSRQGRDEATLERIRERTIALTTSGAIRPVMTQPVLWELGSILDDATPGEGGKEMHEKVVRFYLELAHERLMLHEPVRQRLELESAMPLRDHQVIFPAELAHWLANALNEEWSRKHLEQLHAVKDSDRAEERKKREATRAEFQKRFGDAWEQGLADALSPATWEETITKNTADEIRKHARKEGMLSRNRALPSPRAARTFWYGESFYFSKARHVFVANPKKDLLSNSAIKAMPDLVDMTHLRDSAYVDVMVSSDTNLLAVALEARVQTRFLTFEEYAREIG